MKIKLRNSLYLYPNPPIVYILSHLTYSHYTFIYICIFSESLESDVETLSHFAIFFKKDFIYLFLRRGKEGERKGEKHQCVLASHVSPTGDLALNLGMCPDWESNW